MSSMEKALTPRCARRAARSGSIQVQGGGGLINGHATRAAPGPGHGRVTAGMIDNTDLFLEELGPDGRSVRRGGEFVPCEVIPEEIAVRGGDSIDLDVLVTDRGPIVGPAFEGGANGIF